VSDEFCREGRTAADQPPGVTTFSLARRPPQAQRPVVPRCAPSMNESLSDGSNTPQAALCVQVFWEVVVSVGGYLRAMTFEVVLRVLSVVVPTAAVIIAWYSIRRQAVEAARAALEGQRLAAFADDIARAGRDLRDAVNAPGGCPGCGKGVPARRLHLLGADVDRIVDLALVHVRDEDLASRVGRARAVAREVTRHRRSLTDACDELLADAVSLAIVCDRAAEATLAFLHTGTVRVGPRIRTPVHERVLGWMLDRVFRMSDDPL
jgi:hypothetical protein